MLGDLMSPFTNDAQPAGVAQQWTDFFKNPTTQAMLLNAGLELMKPRWQPGSALPDAIGAAAKTAHQAEQQDYAREQEEEKRAQAAGDKEETRKTQLEIARLNADSRAEVANIRTGAMLEGVRLKQELKGGPTNPAETKAFETFFKKAADNIRAQNTAYTNAGIFKKELLDKVVPAEQINDLARAQAQKDLIEWRLEFGGGGGTGATPRQPAATGQGPAKAGGPLPSPGAPQPGKTTSGNSQNEAPLKPTLAEKKAQIEAANPGAWEQILKSPRHLRMLLESVRDPHLMPEY